MKGCSRAEVRPTFGAVPESPAQGLENTGLKSAPMRWKVIAGGGGGRAADAPEAASFADRNAAAAWRRRYLDWMESRLPRASTDLFARLPFSDAVALAALVGTGRMTWPEINAALDAMLKLAAADAPDGDWRGHDASLTEDIVERVVEEEIWARYHAQCDEVFADQSGLTDPGPWSREQVWRTERILDRLRCARDRELALVRRRWDARSLAPAESEIRLEQSQAALPWMELSPAEDAALDKLDATGFIASDRMVAAIDSRRDR